MRRPRRYVQAVSEEFFVETEAANGLGTEEEIRESLERLIELGMVTRLPNGMLAMTDTRGRERAEDAAPRPRPLPRRRRRR